MTAIYAGTTAWLAARKKGIGASDAAVALGMSPYATPLDLYREKTGESDAKEVTWEMRRGTLLEPFLVEAFTTTTGIEVAEYPCPMQWHPDHPWMYATPDGRIDADTLVELKTTRHTTRDQLGDEGSDVMPVHWNLQCQHQMAVTGAKRVHVFVMWGFDQSWHGVVARNDRLIDLLIGREREFWSMVEARMPPLPDFSNPKTYELVKDLFPVDEGKVLEMPNRMAAAWMQRQKLEQRIKSMQKRAEKLKARVTYGMQDSQIAYHPETGWELVRTKVEEQQVAAHTKKAHTKLTQRKRKNEYRSRIEDAAGQGAGTDLIGHDEEATGCRIAQAHDGGQVQPDRANATDANAQAG